MMIVKKNPPALRATSPGSSPGQALKREGIYKVEYYAWRHLPFATFQSLNTLLAVVDTLNRIPTDVTEPHVARMKLAFFQSDIARAASGNAQHPDIQALSAILKTEQLDLSPFNDLCIALETEIDRVQSIDDNDLNRYCKRKRGSVLLLCGQLLKNAPLTDIEKTNLNNIGIFIERISLLQNRDTHPEKIHLFSLKDFSQADYIAQTRTFFNRNNATPALKPIFLLARLYEAQLNHFEKSLPLNPMKLLALSLYYRLKGC
ncbi:MAG: squalene/phytoene synthase family protein [Gammaproteobacteria bacterium]